MDMRLLRGLATTDGPFASVYLDLAREPEQWRAVRGELADQGAPDDILTALDESIGRAAAGGGPAGHALVAAGGRVLVDEPLGVPPNPAIARWSDLPYLVPLASSAHGVDHVVAMVERSGAELHAVDRWGTERASATLNGRSHRGFDVLVGEARRLADLVGARLLVLTGDVPTHGELRSILPTSCAGPAVAVAHGNGSRDAVERRVRELVEEYAREPAYSELHRFAVELARPKGLAVQGLAPSAAMLREGNAVALVLAPRAEDDRSVWVSGTRRDQVSAAEEQLRGRGLPVDRQRADEALPLAALAVDADVIVPTGQSALSDGVGVLLRHGPT